VTLEDDLVVTGRAKDTIVLTNGENIEPQPIEDACLRSSYIDNYVGGTGDRSDLIVPNLEALQQWNAQNLYQTGPGKRELRKIKMLPKKIDLESKIVQNLFRQELNREVQNRPGYRQ